MYDLIVIGGGPAGLAGACAASRASGASGAAASGADGAPVSPEWEAAALSLAAGGTLASSPEAGAAMPATAERALRAEATDPVSVAACGAAGCPSSRGAPCASCVSGEAA